MTDHDPTPEGELTMASAIRLSGQRRANGRKLRTSRLLRGGRLVLALGLAAGFLAAGVAGAATGLLPVGAIISSGEDPDFRHGGPSVRQTVVATGSTPVGGPWQMTAYKSEGIVDDKGNVAEPAGMPCLLMELVTTPEGTLIPSSVLCRAPGKADFNMFSQLAIDKSAGKVELVLYGFTPPSAISVELTDNNGQTIEAETRGVQPEFPGGVWVIAVPPGLQNAQLSWIDRNGKIGATRDPSRHLDSLVAASAPN